MSPRILLLGVLACVLERASSAEPAMDALLKEGRDQAAKKAWDRASTAFESATRTDPTNSDAWSGLALARLELGALDAARDSAQHAVSTARTGDTRGRTQSESLREESAGEGVERRLAEWRCHVAHPDSHRSRCQRGTRHALAGRGQRLQRKTA